MSNPKSAMPQMGDLIGKTKDRITAPQEPDNGNARLASLVAATTPSAPPQGGAQRSVTPLPGYFEQQPEVAPSKAKLVKKAPVKKETRDQHTTMRLSPSERQRFVEFCEVRNISMADGIKALMDHYDETTAH